MRSYVHKAGDWGEGGCVESVWPEKREAHAPLGVIRSGAARPHRASLPSKHSQLLAIEQPAHAGGLTRRIPATMHDYDYEAKKQQR